MTVNMAVLAPIPNASVRTAVNVNPGLLKRVRAENRTSWRTCSSQSQERSSRCSSFACSIPP